MQNNNIKDIESDIYKEQPSIYNIETFKDVGVSVLESIGD
jgi:hypothetical protein